MQEKKMKRRKCYADEDNTISLIIQLSNRKNEWQSLTNKENFMYESIKQEIYLVKVYSMKSSNWSVEKVTWKTVAEGDESLFFRV